MKIYHNPRCRKSRETLAIIESKGVSPEVIKYLDQPPSEAELDQLLKGLGKEPLELIRKGEDSYKANFKGKEYSRNEWIKIMVENPKLIERPIVVSGDKVVLGRPPENVLDLF